MKKKQTVVSSDQNNDLEKQAQIQLNSRKYKEAIRLYKKLLQETEKDEWHQQLAYCYLQRALAFSTKGMYREAVELWENHCQHVQSPYEYHDHYISWLLQTKNPTRIQSSLGQLSAQQLDKQFPELAVILGFLMITEHPEFEQFLPEDTVFIAHFKLAQSALIAYQNNTQEEVNDTLKQIPYRSAFKDFRTLLKAAITVPTSTTQTQELLDKIPDESPYSQTAKLLLASTYNGSVLAQEVVQFNHKQRKIIGEIKGLNKKQLEFIEQLAKQKKPLSDKVKFNLAIRYQSLCSSELAQSYCHATLATYPAGRRDYNKNFDSINLFEENRFRALLRESDNNSYEAEYYWKECINILARNDTDNALKIALILRHIAAQRPDYEQTELLIESLDHDPEDRDCYLQLLRYFGQQQETVKDYKKWLAKTIKKFPQDIEVLTQAAQVATRNKTYQKATQHALKILKIDPLNSVAKQLLFSSHLAHARQLLQGKKFHLVEKEIQQAEAMKMSKALTLQAQLMRGLLCYVGEDKQLGLKKIAESMIKLNSDPINACFQATIESLITGLPVATVLRELPPAKDHLLSAQELTRFIQLIKQYHLEDSNQGRLHKALEKIKAPVKKSLQQQEYDETQLLTLAQALDEVHHFELLRHCSKLAIIRWPKPIWVYYKIYSETNNNPEKCSFQNILQLETNQQQARQEKDHRAMVLIDNYLDHYYQTHPQAGLGFLDNLFGDDDEEDDFEDYLEDPMEMFDHLPDEVFFKLQTKISSLIKKTSPERLVQGLDDIIGDKNSILLAISQDPDIFMALLILKAADDLKIDIGISVDDVFKRFGVDNKPRSFPF